MVMVHFDIRNEIFFFIFLYSAKTWHIVRNNVYFLSIKNNTEVHQLLKHGEGTHICLQTWLCNNNNNNNGHAFTLLTLAIQDSLKCTLGINVIFSGDF